MTPLNATGWTLIHFLWQGAIIVVMFAIVDAVSRRASAWTRYAVASCAMMLMLASAVTTFVHFVNNPSSSRVRVATTPSPIVFAPMQRIAGDDQRPPADYLPWLVYIWVTGVTLLSLRLTVQWAMLERCRKQGIRTLDGTWDDRIGRIIRRLQLKRAVRAYESTLADVPSVVGWLRPVILVPTSALLQLAPTQIEALLAHELAHVRRHDYLMNLLQSCVETLFFYHPGVWWVGRRMREERENCCDDVAVAVCGDPMVYARALVDLERFRGAVPELAMSANGGSLFNRIERLIGPHPTTRSTAPVGITALTILVSGAFMWAAQQPAPQKPESRAPKPSPVTQPPKPVAPSAGMANRQPQPVPSKATTATNQESYLDQLERAGYRNLTVDQMIAMKIHDVTGDYIAEIKSLGWSPTPDQLVAFRIHGVNAETVKQLRTVGFPLTPDQAVAARIHDVTSAFAEGFKQQGLKGLDFEHLIALKIHGADPAQLRELKTLGFGEISADDLVGLRVAGVTPEFIREVRSRGFHDLRLEQIIQLKRLGILGSKEPK